MIGDFYTHNKKGGRYKVVNLAEFKSDNKDLLCVIYTDSYGVLYVRLLREFICKFSKIKE